VTTFESESDAAIDRATGWLEEAERWRSSTYVEVDTRGVMITACANAADSATRLAELLYRRHQDDENEARAAALLEDVRDVNEDEEKSDVIGR
jgi:transcriptional/translational regulatory protein YebC/TACO1